MDKIQARMFDYLNQYGLVYLDSKFTNQIVSIIDQGWANISAVRTHQI